MVENMHDDLAAIQEHPQRFFHALLMEYPQTRILKTAFNVIHNGFHANQGGGAHHNKMAGNTGLGPHFHHHDIFRFPLGRGLADQIDLFFSFDVTKTFLL